MAALCPGPSGPRPEARAAVPPRTTALMSGAELDLMRDLAEDPADLEVGCARARCRAVRRAERHVFSLLESNEK